MPNANVVKLQRQRALVLKSIKNVLEAAKKARDNGEYRTEFFLRYGELDGYVTRFENLQYEIIALVDESALEEEEAVHTMFDDMRYSIRGIHKDLSDEMMARSEHETSAVVVRENCLRLPKIEIPKFDGDLTRWPTFIDLFNTLIHRNNSLSKIEKFQFLISYLEKEAGLIVRNVPITEDNYEIAYNALMSRYQNERVLLSNYWFSIYNASPSRHDSAVELRKLLSIFSENLVALEMSNLNLWDFTKFNLLLQKLPSSLKTRFELEHNGNNVPGFDMLFGFVEKTCRALENTSLTSAYQGSNVSNASGGFRKNNSPANPKGRQTLSFSTGTLTQEKCNFCKGSPHSLIKCDRFLQAECRKRHAFVKRTRMCFNCLGATHLVNKCKSKELCGVCGGKHHVLLHFPDTKVTDCDVSGSTSNESESHVQVMASKLSVQPRMLLATALVSILDSEGRSTKCRVLLDSASQANFISESCVRRLNLTRKEYSTPVVGINGMSSNVSSGKVSCVIFPYSKPYPSFNLEAIVIPQICEKVPQIPAVVQKWKYLENLCLAEPLAAHDEMEIDLLLGVEVFGEILRSGYVRGQNGGPHAINTVFGWVLMGKLGGVSTNSVLNFLTSVGELDCTLKKFWEIESIPKCVALSEEEQQAEEFFTSSCWRMDSGRYVVKLPFSEFPPVLGDSYSQALHRFKLLEGRFRRDSVLHEAYCDFMADYLEQGHMSEVGNQVGSNSEYYIPHHAVVKRNANGEIKLRTVFDASAKTTNGKSLNDVLLAGPKLQNDIVSILLSFRLYLYVFTADIRQMYRQILVEESHTSYQTILWRPNGDEPIRKYQLKTVTYGVTSSPFLAIRTLLQLCRDEGERFPLAVNILENFCYVDDAIGVANSKEIALDTQNQLIELLALGKFELRKWASNCSEVLAQVPEVHQQPLVFDKDSLGIKVLGLQWCPTTDCFSYSVHPQIRSCTKRNILSEIARLYDPLGFLAPVIIVPKQILQQLWALGIGWDDEPPLEVANQWKTFVAELPELSSLKIPRHILHIEAKFTEIHAFCDASEKSYAAVVYLRQVSTENSISVHLVCAKTRVAPLKRLSIPRLELCAALLAAELIDCVSHIMVTQKIDNVCAWTDSKVVVTWVKSSPHRWRSFVANRVAIIQEKVAPDSWYHVVGKENPSDCASRGTFPRQFLEQPLWWEGPTWLKLPRDDWPVTCVGEPSCTDVQEEAKVVCITIHGSSIVSELLNRYSSLRKIERVVAYCLRFRKNCLCRKRGYPREIGNLSEAELYEAMVVLVKDVQRVELDNELRKVRRAEVCPKAIQKLAPFIDSQGVLRVGGRLRQSSLSYDRKHPILLPRKHRLTYLIIQSVHNRSCHPGPQTLHYLLRQRYWILSAKRAIASVLSRCIKCFRVKPPPVVPIMSDLPSVRISEVKPFSHSGVDLFGPLRMSLGKRRGISSQKVYVCLFVCMATKAIHLEVVSDLTSEAVLAALRRFIGRRGRCSDIYSDQGTNFVGAYKTLQLLGAKASEALQIKWHFNPPASPSFGGIWESGVKSVKTHLRRVIGAQVLTYEELSTTLIQIEAMLNSRPLCSLSSDPNDVGSLTPGHFLTLEPLNAPPDEDLLCVKHSRLNRWQLVQQMQQHFWRRWHMEYLHTLQQRHKWNTPHNPPSVGQLVLLKDENTRPLQWPLGRIIKLYPGTGNISRVAQVKTSKGLLDRPLLKLCPLPAQ